MLDYIIEILFGIVIVLIIIGALGQHQKPITGIVTDKKISPPITITRFQTVNNMTIPQTSITPKQFVIIVDSTKRLNVKESEWLNINIGDSISNSTRTPNQ